MFAAFGFQFEWVLLASLVSLPIKFWPKLHGNTVVVKNSLSFTELLE